MTITVADLLKNALEKEGLRTVMTHDGESIPAEYNWDGNDIFNPNERVSLMNALDPDYIVSLHTNTAANPDAHGVQIYYDHVSAAKENDWNEPAAEIIARTIDERMGFGEEDATALRNPVNAENGSLAVTRDSRAAAVLIELGFSTNEENAKNLIDPEWQADIASAVAEGVGRFFDSMGMTAKEVLRPAAETIPEDGDSAEPVLLSDSGSLSPFGAVDWRFENGKYIYDFPARNAEGLKTFDEMYAFPTTRFEDANKPPDVDNWFPGQVFYDETTGETSYGWDRWDSTKEIFKKYGAIYRGDESRKVCYLTFDCGYEIGMTASLLDTLKEKQAPGTFFVTGPFVRGESADFTKEYMHNLTRRMLDEGHVVGSHTNTHPDMTMLTADEAVNEMRQVEADFAREFPDAPELLFFRPPAGAVNEWLIRLEAKLGCRTVTWSATYRDYVVDEQWAYDDALNLLKSCLHPGCVYLLHTESATNAALLPELIDWIRAQGCVIEPLCGIGA